MGIMMFITNVFDALPKRQAVLELACFGTDRVRKAILRRPPMVYLDTLLHREQAKRHCHKCFYKRPQKNSIFCARCKEKLVLSPVPDPTIKVPV